MNLAHYLEFLDILGSVGGASFQVHESVPARGARTGDGERRKRGEVLLVPRVYIPDQCNFIDRTTLERERLIPFVGCDDRQML
jgi:hypothetical protein